jgi:hypothetical protein
MPYYQSFKAPTAELAKAAAEKFVKQLPFMSDPSIDKVVYIEHPDGKKEWSATVIYYTLD